MRPNASGTTRANTSLTIGSLNDRKIFVTRSSAGSITCGTIHKRSKAYFVLFFNSHVELLMRAYIADKISPDLEFQLFDFSVLNKLSPGAKGTSEAIEFICPRTALKQFVNAEITNQQLLDQSFILVNGVRIALNLQLVE